MQSSKSIVNGIMYKMEQAFRYEESTLLKGTELEFLIDNISKRDVEEMYAGSGIVWQRYRKIQKIMRQDIFAQNVFDLALAEYMCPEFIEIVKDRTGMGCCIYQGVTAESALQASYEQFHTTWENVKRLLRVEENSTPFYMRECHMDDRLFGYLNGDNGLPSQLQTFASLFMPEQETEDICGMEEIISQVERQMELEQLFYVEGRSNSGRRTVVCQAAANRKQAVLLLELGNIGMEELQKNLFDIQRELYFYNAFLCIHGLSAEWLEKEGCTKESFLHFCSMAFGDKGFAMCFCVEPGLFLMQVSRMQMMEIVLPEIGRTDRIKLWEFFAERYGLLLPVEQLGIKYRLLPGEIEKACELLKSMYGENTEISEQEIANACQKVLPAVAVRGRIIYANENMTFEDLKLPKPEKQKLLDICNHVRLMHQVMDKWNMESRFSYGKAVSVLFCGDSGTGKTMAANLLAKELGYPLYHVDLSQMIDKYIGETEKHLQQIFDQAQRSNTILFFDEADAIFGKRSDIKDSKDRHANTQVSYILQRIEEYDGIVILATNLKENIDSAFMRRIKYLVHFQRPTEEVRQEIWESCFPKEMPVEDIDFTYLARNFELSGGNIKNIILTAAFYAAAEQRAVGMEHMIRAIKNEYQKMGRLLMREELGMYAQYLET